jgi:hypothetical protein
VNKQAEAHLAKAKEYVAKGEQFYRMAAEQMRATKEAGATWVEIADGLGRSESWVRDTVAWHETPANNRRGPTPFAGKDAPGERNERATRQVLRDSSLEEIEKLVTHDPEVRDKVGRAISKHYTQRAKESAERHHEREVERKGGEEEYADHQARQRLAEIVSVARGATSGWQFVAGQIRTLEIDPGVAEELTALANDTEGFVSLIRSVLSGEEITDEMLSELIGDQS